MRISDGVQTCALPIWQRSSTWLFILALGLLVLVLIPGIGVKVNAARRWINIGVFGLQASEPVRLALIIYVASYITRRQQELQTSFKGLAMPEIGSASCRERVCQYV